VPGPTNIQLDLTTWKPPHQRAQPIRLFSAPLAALLAVFTAVAASGLGAAARPQASPAAPAQEELWEGMNQKNDKYDWLHPPDSVLQEALTEAADRTEARSLPYTYQCGEILGCREKFRFGKKRAVGRVILATPVQLVAAEVRDRWGRFSAPPPLEEARKHNGTFTVSVLTHARKKNDKPSLTLQVSGTIVQPADTQVSGRTVERCWVDRGDKCWRSLYTATFTLPAGQTPKGTGAVIIEWADVTTSIPLDFDYLW
jgi:hypothetical protein